MWKILCLFLVLSPLLSSAAFADDGDLTNEEIVRELKDGPAYKPNHFILNVKPISFIVGQTFGKDAPFPMKCIQVKGRLFRNLGLQVEPVFVVGGEGGFGFTVGPAYFPAFPWDEWHVGPKYEFDYLNTEGGFHGFMMEFDRHRRFGHFVLTYGGALGFGVAGVAGSEDSDGNFEILEVTQGLTFDVNLGLGFAL